MTGWPAILIGDDNLVPPWMSLAMITMIHGDHQRAEQFYKLLTRDPLALTVGLRHDRLLGLVAYTAGKWDLAVQHLERSIAFLRPARYWPELCWSCLDLGRILAEL